MIYYVMYLIGWARGLIWRAPDVAKAQPFTTSTSTRTSPIEIGAAYLDTRELGLYALTTGLVKKQLQKAIGGAVRTALEYVDGQLAGVRDQMAEAKASEDRGRRDVLREQLARRRKLDCSLSAQ